MCRHGLIEFEAVLAIVRRGSFRAGALELGMSTTALSNAIGKLERELGVRFFNRTTRSVSLTDAGRTFVNQIGPALENIHEAMNAARSQQETPSGTLRINAFATAAREILSPLILEFLRRYPQVHIDLVTEGRLIDVFAEGFDLGIRGADLVPGDTIAIPLGPVQRFAVVATPSYFKSHEVPRVPQDLLRHPCIRVRLPNGALYRWHFQKDEQPVQLDVPGPITLDEASLARMAALEGVGFGFFMAPDVREDIAAGRLVQVLKDWTPPLSPLCLYYPSRRNPSAAFRAFVSLAREVASSSQASRAQDPGLERRLADGRGLTKSDDQVVHQQSSGSEAGAMGKGTGITLYGIKNCDTMKKARAWLDAHGVAYAFHDCKAAGIDEGTLRGWVRMVGWETLLNRAGTTFRKLPESDKAGLTEAKAIALMLAQPAMIKRPVLARRGEVLVGFKPDVYEKTLA